MKRIYLLLLGVVVIQLVNAQSSPLMIFDRFIDAKIHFKNRSVTVVPMNYDAANDKMYFISDDNYMELTNAAMIDSISWAKQRCFVPSMQGYLEKNNLSNGTVYIHWRIRNVNVGAKGAMGAVTQAKVEQINIRSMGVFSSDDRRINSADVYQQKCSNEYYLTIDGNLKEVTKLKHLYKLYPAHKDIIQEYAENEKIKMDEPLSVLQLLNFCLGLK